MQYPDVSTLLQRIINSLICITSMDLILKSYPRGMLSPCVRWPVGNPAWTETLARQEGDWEGYGRLDSSADRKSLFLTFNFVKKTFLVLAYFP